MSKRILFLYISPSSGHQHAAEAVREAFSLLSPTWETFGIDSFTYAYPTIGRLIARTYLEVLRRTPLLWDFLYDNPDVETATREIRELLNVMSGPKMKALLRRYSPDALVCTQAVPCSVFAAEKRAGKIHLPLIAIVTDFAVHSYWIYPEVDLYCVASEDICKQLIRHGIPASKIAVTGIPISPKFLRRHSKVQARWHLGLDPQRSTILLMGGSQGLGPIQDMLDALHQQPLQFILATGLNRDLFRSLKKRYARDKRVCVTGYSKSVNLFMDAADLLVTKPGGMTSSEALAKGLPMLLTSPIPGQEERNARYLLDQGVALRVDDPADIAEAVKTLFLHPQRLRKMTENALARARPHAAMEVAQRIFELTSQNDAPAAVDLGPVKRNMLESVVE